MTASLTDWLALLEQRHPTVIDLGLERVGAVWCRLGQPPLATHVVSVGGTNGKGSTVALIDTIARRHGRRVGAYTSPHLLRFNERIAIDGMPVDDARLLGAFATVEAARGATSLTFFEFTTLAAFVIFAEAELDLVVLEVGLGGRLDAVNLIDADVSIVTTVDLDHQAYLGPDVDSIGWEKAHIFRGRRPALCGMPNPPARLRAHAMQISARLECVEHDFAFDGARYRDEAGSLESLRSPALEASVQRTNAALALRALRAMGATLNPDLINAAFANVRIRGRLERVQARPALWVDVAHNAQAARSLATWLGRDLQPTVAIFACLADKDLEAIVEPLIAHIDEWAIVELHGPRARPADDIATAIKRLKPGVTVATYPTVVVAWQALSQRPAPPSRTIAFGSFLLAEQALR
jgi:dihydrofolate synthase / folylpolyglutamate synthase